MWQVISRTHDNTIRSSHGFTFIEVMIVVVIAGILAMIAYPSYQSAVRKAKRAEGRSALMQLMQQQERYYSQNTSYIAFTSASTNANEKYFKWYSADSPAASAYEIRAEACSNETIRTCVRLTAKPGTEKVDSSYMDAECGSLTFTSTGIKSADGKNCW
ncbi:MAG: type IV pilin protein [Burkholderiaceae bacterium]